MSRGGPACARYTVPEVIKYREAESKAIVMSAFGPNVESSSPRWRYNGSKDNTVDSPPGCPSSRFVHIMTGTPVLHWRSRQTFGYLD